MRFDEYYDVVIVGTGAAGLYCALNFPKRYKVLLLTKQKADECDSFLAQGGICMQHGEADYRSFFEDTMRAGHYENDAATVDLMIRSSNSIIRDLVRREVVNVPLLGTVAAGVPLLAVENVENYFPIPAELLPNSETFMLKVRGNSMIDVGIYDGDRVIVEQTSVAENGEIVVALIDDSATVKRFFKENGHYRLQPENATMDPIIVDKVQILGKVIGLLRLMR